MPTPALLLLLAALMPLASFVLLAFLGRRLGNPLAGWVATAMIFGSFALSSAGMIAWYNTGQIAGLRWGPGIGPIELSFKWLPAGAGVAQEHPGFLDLDIYIDSLTVAMFNTVTVVLLLGHAFAVSHMARQKCFARFFTSLALLCFAMLGLLLAGTLLQLLIFWELLAVGAYLLIGLGEDPTAAQAAGKTLLLNRIGDGGFLVGLGILFSYLGNVTLAQLDGWLGTAGLMNRAAAIHLPNGMNLSCTMLSIAGIALFVGVVAKSGQFPLHTWLADSAVSPISAAALIQSVTLTAAGVYVLGRIFPLLTADAKLFIAIVGLVTLVIGSLIALAQRDIRQVLAHSTMAQFGLMVMAMGIGSWVGALFLLVTHAFCKGLLQLSAGSVIRAAGGETDLWQYGGLLKKLPLTAFTFAIGALALAGMPFTCGYYSNEMIFIHAGAAVQNALRGGHGCFFWVFFLVPAIAAGVTALYMMRCWMLIFWGRPRHAPVPQEPFQSSPLLFPLVALAGLTLIGGSRLLEIKTFLNQSAIETENYCNATRPTGAAAFAGFAQAWPIDVERAGTSAERSKLEAGERLFHRDAVWVFAVGLGLGFLLYCRGQALARAFVSPAPLRAAGHWLYRRMYFDEIYFGLLVVPTSALSRAVAGLDRLLGGGRSGPDRRT